jgi:guanylate kinase
MNNKGRSPDSFGLIVVSAPSGAGKSTLCAELLKRNANRLSLSISSTSRQPRGSEVHAKEYFFLSGNEFQSKIDQGIFVEWANVHGNFYGTSRETLDLFWSQQKHVLLDIDVQGSETLRNAFGPRAFTVFIAPPSMEVLEQRLRGRGTDSEEVIQKRMFNAREEMKQMDRFDLTVVNDDFQQAYQQLEQSVLSFMDQHEEGLWQKRP